MQTFPPPASYDRRVGSDADRDRLLAAATNGGWSSRVLASRAESVRRWAMHACRDLRTPITSEIRVEGELATVIVRRWEPRSAPPASIRPRGCICAHEVRHATTTLGCPETGCDCIAPIPEAQDRRPQGYVAAELRRRRTSRRRAGQTS